MTVLGNPNNNALRFRRGTGITLLNSEVAGSASCLRVDGTSRDLIGAFEASGATETVTFAGDRFNCAALVQDGTDADGTLTNYVNNTAVGVTTDATAPTVQPLPADGFFETNGVIGADLQGWAGNWAQDLDQFIPQQ